MLKFLKYNFIVIISCTSLLNALSPDDIPSEAKPTPKVLNAIEMIPDPTLMPEYAEEIKDQLNFSKQMSNPSMEPTIENASIIESWNALPDITAQTLQNFSQGKRQGILLIHSLEDFSSTPTPSLKAMKKRKGVDQQFVNEYINGVLAFRYHIASSLIAFGQDGTTFPTFGSSSFILSCDADHIVATSLQDCSSADSCYPLEHPDLRNNGSWTNYHRKEIKSLDTLAAFPNMATVNDDLTAPEMNEIVISPCIVRDNSVKYAKVVGVLFDHRVILKAQRGLGNRDLDNRSPNWFQYMQNFAVNHNLPFIEIGKTDVYKITWDVLQQKLTPFVDSIETVVKADHARNPVDHDATPECSVCKRWIEMATVPANWCYNSLPYLQQQRDYRFSDEIRKQFGIL
jgi:hypothetical protein